MTDYVGENMDEGHDRLYWNEAWMKDMTDCVGIKH